MKRPKAKNEFWRLMARAEIAIQRKLGVEFARHEEAVRKILIEMRVSRKP